MYSELGSCCSSCIPISTQWVAQRTPASVLIVFRRGTYLVMSGGVLSWIERLNVRQEHIRRDRPVLVATQLWDPRLSACFIDAFYSNKRGLLE